MSVLLTLGLLMMTSASVEIASSRYGDPFFTSSGRVCLLCWLYCDADNPSSAHEILAQYQCLSAGAFFRSADAGFNSWRWQSRQCSARWIDLGFFNLQPSELAKVFIVIYVAAYLERHADEVRVHLLVL